MKESTTDAAPRVQIYPQHTDCFFKDRHYLHHEWALFLRGEARAGGAAEAGAEGGTEGRAEGGGGLARDGDAGAGAGSAGGGGGCGGSRGGCVCERCVAIRRVVLECSRIPPVFPQSSPHVPLFPLSFPHPPCARVEARWGAGRETRCSRCSPTTRTSSPSPATSPLALLRSSPCVEGLRWVYMVGGGVQRMVGRGRCADREVCACGGLRVALLLAHMLCALMTAPSRPASLCQSLSLPLHVCVRVRTCMYVSLPLHVFVLSAISPEKMPLAVANVATVLSFARTHHVPRPTTSHGVAWRGMTCSQAGMCWLETMLLATLLSHATVPCHQERLRRKEQRIADNFYVRGDGTRAYYFTEGALGELFAGAGMQCVHMGVCERTVTNRARQIDMHRRWIQAVFRLPLAATAAPAAPCDAAATASEDVEARGTNGREGGEEERRGSGSSVVRGDGNGREGARTEEGGTEEGGRGGSDSACEVDCSSLFISDPPLEVLLSPSPLFFALVAPVPIPSLLSTLSIPTTSSTLPSISFPPPIAPPGPRPVPSTPAAARAPAIAGAPARARQHGTPAVGVLAGAGGAAARPPRPHPPRHRPRARRGRRCALLACSHSGAPRVIVATDGDESALSLLPGNLELNAGSFETGRIKVCRLRWGNEGDEAAVRQLLPSDDVVGAEQGRVQEERGSSTAGTEGSDARTAPVGGSSMKGDDTEAAYTTPQQGRGFDVILGADVVYVRAAVPLLFQSAARLLARRDGSGGRVPVLLLCHITRQVLEPKVLAAAAAAGLEVAEGEVAERVGGSVERAMQAALGTVFPGEGRDASLFRLLCFRASRLP
ncbi:unnamed protein product [Closterium sp. Naga37s-1]|nr:unnamed protein product [Closterium sp. Naga37s-1]